MSGIALPAAAAVYFWRYSPQGVFSALTVMLGWRCINNLSNCNCRSKKTASHVCPTLISILSPGSAIALLGHAPVSPAVMSKILSDAGSAAASPSAAASLAGSDAVWPHAASSSPMLAAPSPMRKPMRKTSRRLMPRRCNSRANSSSCLPMICTPL